MNKPNLFRNAASELSQDAFFAWLLEWASAEYEPDESTTNSAATKDNRKNIPSYNYDDHQKMRTCSKEFVKLLIREFYKQVPQKQFITVANVDEQGNHTYENISVEEYESKYPQTWSDKLKAKVANAAVFSDVSTNGKLERYKTLPIDYEIADISVKQQHATPDGRIDILAVVNYDYIIVIEDKTHSQRRDNQLARYKDFAAKKAEEMHIGCGVVLIYLKTGMESEQSLQNIRKEGYAVIDRSTLLDFFAMHDIRNNIYADFVENLKEIKDYTESYEEEPIGSWCTESWQGFFRFLELPQNIGCTNTNCGNVYQQGRGSFLFFHHSVDLVDEVGEVFMQIESDTGNLCFKVAPTQLEEDEKVASPLDAATKWQDVVERVAIARGNEEIVTNCKIRAGNTMTVAYVSQEVWLGEKGSMADVDAVVVRLKEYESFLKKCIDYYYNEYEC